MRVGSDTTYYWKSYQCVLHSWILDHLHPIAKTVNNSGIGSKTGRSTSISVFSTLSSSIVQPGWGEEEDGR